MSQPPLVITTCVHMIIAKESILTFTINGKNNSKIDLIGHDLEETGVDYLGSVPLSLTTDMNCSLAN